MAYGLAERCYQFQRMMGWARPLDPELDVGAQLARLAGDYGSNDSEVLWMDRWGASRIYGCSHPWRLKPVFPSARIRSSGHLSSMTEPGRPTGERDHPNTYTMPWGTIVAG